MENLNRTVKIELLITILSLAVILLFPPIGVLISFICVLLYLAISKNRKIKFNSIGFISPKSWLRTILISLFLGIIIELSFQIIFNPLIEIITRSEIDLSAYQNVRGNFSNYLIMILIGWSIGGFLEEILFRGFLLTRIASIFKNKILSNTIGIIITSATFGFSHLYQSWSGVLSTGFIAVIFGIIFIRSNKILWFCIFTHGFVNMISLGIIYLEVEQVLKSLLF